MVEDNRCPNCKKKGVTSILMELESPVGTLQNLCSNPLCCYPFSDYKALKVSRQSDSPLKSSSTTTSPAEPNEAFMDEFLNELFGCSNEEMESTRGTPDCHGTLGIGQPSEPSTVPSRHISSLRLPDKFTNSFNRDLQTSPNILRSQPRTITSNCMLPRYLADNIKRATSNAKAIAYCHPSPAAAAAHKSIVRDANGSDSGISVTSVSTHASTPITYAEYVYEKSSSHGDITPTSTPSNQSSKQACPIRIPTETVKPISRVESLIQYHKTRFNKLLD